MTLKQLVSLFDNWNGTLTLNDDNLETIYKGNFGVVFGKYRDWNVVAFGFHNGELCVRIRENK